MLSKQDETLVELLGQDDPKVRSLIWAARNPAMRDAVRNMLRNMAREKGWDPDDPPEFALPKDLSPSDYALGHAVCGEMVGEEIGLSKEDLQGGGIGIFGLSGVGKTTLVKILLLVFSGKEI